RSTTQPKSVTIERWEEADALLARAVARFFDTSTLLERQCTTLDESSNDLVTRIDLSLDYLQTTINRQLTDARLALAKTRNRLTRSVLSLPREVLSEIFLYVVYDPIDQDDPCNLAIDMETRVETIYRRLHSLLAVCVSWRNVGLACGALWSVIPVVDPLVGQPRDLSTDLSLQRAGGNGLDLAISLSHESLDRLWPLAKHLSRFGTININQKHDGTTPLSGALRVILDYLKPGTLSKLSLEGASDAARGVFMGYYDPDPPEFSKPNIARLESNFIQLVQSLSALRIRSVALNWERMAFSACLVILRIGRVSLGHSGISSLIAALSSAQGLRKLELISIRALTDENRTKAPSQTLSFPKLESLYLADLNFNILQLFMEVISPGSYYLTVGLTAESCASFFFPGPDIDWAYEYVDHTSEEVCDLLRAASIDKLILTTHHGCVWDEAADLRALLKSVPTVKTLVLNSCSLSLVTLKALKQPPRPPRWAHTRNDIFPKLECIEFQCSTISSSLSDLKIGFKHLLIGHPIQRMAIGRSCGSGKTPPIDEHDEIIEWLKSKIPRFLFSGEQDEPPNDFDTWQLWDL
ncbi:hypothetical protein FRC11_001750, partial [Ceratobasidium sp. 423]